ncbi:MAG TPA: acetyl-CoA C-acetyltransferase [Acidobacteriota bacterium]|nr:acetyl-CoA C-acetyltransferase [Acidobacteriota bacterium]
MTGIMRDAFIVSACRTPIGKFQGAFASLTAIQLGTVAVGEAIRRAGLSARDVDEVIMGNVLQAGLGQNPARQAALGAGLPATVSAMTINKVCGSGLKSVTLAAQGIAVGDIEVAVAGGMESMTQAPYLLLKAREGYRLGHGQLVDTMIHDGLWDVYNDYHMGNTAEVICDKYSISREAQDEYAVASHEKAVAAAQAGRFHDEIVAVPVPQRKGDPVTVESDEGPRPGSSLEGLAKLRPAFQKDGRVTAGNASQISDGASALAVASQEAVERLGLKPLARIVASATVGVEPEMVMMAPVGAVTKVRQRAGWGDDDVDLYEINEAFAAQCVAVCQELPLDRGKVNVHGGSVALGHPIGASGARVLTTLLYALKQHGGQRGIASLCLGGGNGVAMAVELL